MKWGRWWLALAYALTALAAPGLHDHDRGAEDAVPESHGDCDETRPHVAGHEAIAHHGAPASCPSCQYRAQQSLAERALEPAPGPSLALPIEVDRSAPLPGSPLRTRCRAPPRA